MAELYLIPYFCNSNIILCIDRQLCMIIAGAKLNFDSIITKIYLVISFNTYSIAKSTTFSTSVMKLLEIGCQVS